MQKAVLFVCMGNICRSPAAEGVLKKRVQESSLGPGVRVDSAGTLSFHSGEPPDSRMSRAAAGRGYQLTGQARGLNQGDFTAFDLIVAMDRENLTGIHRMAGESGRVSARIVLLSDYLEGDWPVDVPDPYYGGSQGFERVLDMVEAACPKILESLLKDDGNTP